MQLVLSIFPGIDLLGRAFEGEGFCVVRGPDLIFGGDILNFYPPSGRFDGVIGGPPCQEFSQLSHLVRSRGNTPRHGNLIPEFSRCVGLASPEWFLMENVIQAPLPEVDGYIVKDLILDNRWLGEKQRRRRRFSFGTKTGEPLIVDVALFEDPEIEPPVVAYPANSNGLKFDRGKPRSRTQIEIYRRAAKRPFPYLCELQGLPADFLKDAPFTVKGKRHAVGNGVPLPMGLAIARAVKRAMGIGD